MTGTGLAVVLTLSALRAAIGLGPLFAPRLSARALGFPDAHDNPTARLAGRLFGVRDVGLGVIGAAGAFDVVPLGFALLFNAATDLGDAASIAVPLVGRHGIDRGAARSLAMAVFGGSCWFVAWLLVAP